MTRAAPFWEKQGATAWAKCPRCATWLPVAATLLASRTIELCCPACNAAFRPEEAGDSVLP